MTAAFVLDTCPYHHRDVTRMVEEVQAEYVELYGGPDAAVVDPAEFAPPRGLFVVGRLAGEPVAMGGWRRFEDPARAAEAEIKRMYVVRGARRRGLARLVLAELERTAAAAGLARLVLNTGPEQPAAIAMYLAAGYGPVPGFGHYADFPGALFYGKELAAGVGART